MNSNVINILAHSRGERIEQRVASTSERSSTNRYLFVKSKTLLAMRQVALVATGSSCNSSCSSNSPFM